MRMGKLPCFCCGRLEEIAGFVEWQGACRDEKYSRKDKDAHWTNLHHYDSS